MVADRRDVLIEFYSILDRLGIPSAERACCPGVRGDPIGPNGASTSFVNPGRTAPIRAEARGSSASERTR